MPAGVFDCIGCFAIANCYINIIFSKPGRAVEVLGGYADMVSWLHVGFEERGSLLKNYSGVGDFYESVGS